ncbi:MAG: hypothetical protein OH319_02080 [Candidatus Parvarchaeota archaeon]|nr:hypothetical protein [Candidatus Jingweiarchaeum tengchongense]MCW1298157.1 hypothetical protein [Candidatus Jingweiarchaeum tengchongense]MCW1299955.1 hypothetical protein [Candidatus Jingweiarchaeum tengchongense]MCW1305060.1 hypothetical protein [Candidatus Jingweiarchaeum tengchongense]MCW1305577.1 hypothetical protein [Candidatus Jingweiarchaeum tengchongense]
MEEVLRTDQGKIVIFLLIIGAVFFIALTFSLQQGIETCNNCYIMGFGNYSDVILILLAMAFLMFVLIRFYTQFSPLK